jgi:predicted MFS family arabinose efflux permease
MIRSALVIAILCASLSVMLSTGIRQSFGLFLQPISESLGTGRETFSLAIAINNIIYGLPLVGLLSDKIGPRWVIIAGGILYAGGLLLMTTITQAVGLYVSLGFMVGLALSATTYVVVLGAVAQIFGIRYLSTLYGVVFFSHQVGTFLGVWLGGRVYDATGAYTPVWMMAIMLGIFAAIVHTPISDKSIVSPQPV